MYKGPDSDVPGYVLTVRRQGQLVRFEKTLHVKPLIGSERDFPPLPWREQTYIHFLSQSDSSPQGGTRMPRLAARERDETPCAETLSEVHVYDALRSLVVCGRGVWALYSTRGADHGRDWKAMNGQLLSAVASSSRFPPVALQRTSCNSGSAACDSSGWAALLIGNHSDMSLNMPETLGRSSRPKTPGGVRQKQIGFAIHWSPSMVRK
ncbi:hypothetical protein FB451DRAFT_1182990 [Mycena latifolia]|nr:hypothetical protein FB451DRAFT_1182990 [Mycena latifolia]